MAPRRWKLGLLCALLTGGSVLAVPAAAAALATFAHPAVNRLLRPLLVFDAAGLALFAVASAVERRQPEPARA